MKAMQLQALDGPGALRVVDVPEPVPGEDEVLIDVEAAGVSFVDLLISRGLYQQRFEAPVVPGIEVAGRVRQAGSGSRVSVGDRVAAFLDKGGFAEQVTAPAALTFRLPDEFDALQGAAYVLNYHTAHFALVRRARLRPGERVLVHGASGGLGSACIQVARAAGASVVAVVRTEEKAELTRRAGAETVIVAGSDWLGRFREQAPGGAVDVAADPVGGPVAEDTVRALAPEGRYLVLGFAGGEIPAVRFNRLLLRNLDVVGAGWGAFLPSDPSLPEATDRALAEMVASGHVRPIVGRVYALDEAQAALEDLDEGRAAAKIVLRV